MARSTSPRLWIWLSIISVVLCFFTVDADALRTPFKLGKDKTETEKDHRHTTTTTHDHTSTTSSTRSHSSAAASTSSSSSACAASSTSTSNGKNKRATELVIKTNRPNKEHKVSANRAGESGAYGIGYRPVSGKFPNESGSEVAAFIKCFTSPTYGPIIEQFQFEVNALKAVGLYVNQGRDSCDKQCVIMHDLQAQGYVSVDTVLASKKKISSDVCKQTADTINTKLKSQVKLKRQSTGYLHKDNKRANFMVKPSDLSIGILDWGYHETEYSSSRSWDENSSGVKEALLKADTAMTMAKALLC